MFLTNISFKRFNLSTAIILLFLCLNMWPRFVEAFYYNQLIRIIILLSITCCIYIIYKPKYIKIILFLFGLSFPFFGLHSYSISNHIFELLLTIVVLTLLALTVRNNVDTKTNQNLKFLIILYISLSTFSLFLIPLGHVIRTFSLWEPNWFAGLIFKATPDSYFYSIAAINRLILFFLLILQISKLGDSKEVIRVFFMGIACACIISVIIGLLEFYDIISLAWLRPNLYGSAKTRLQGMFGNPGWSSEYIIVTVPFVLIGFFKKNFYWKVFLFASLVLCEIFLILTRARAAWISYPLILIFFWSMFYLVKDPYLRSWIYREKDIIKVIVSIPITILLSLFIVFYLPGMLSDLNKIKSRDVPTEKSLAMKGDSFKAQVEGMLNPKGEARVRIWKQTLYIGKQSPLFGMGYESYGWHLLVLNGIPNCDFTKNRALTNVDTPHNFFFQLFISSGLTGLFLWLIIIGYALALLSYDLVRHRNLFNLSVILSIICFHLYGIFQSMQYIPVIWLLIFFNLGYVLTIDERVLPVRIKRLSNVCVKIFVVLVVVSGFVYWNNFESKGLTEKYGLEIYAKDQDRDNYVGFYQLEKWPTGNYRWSGPKGLISFSGRGPIEVDFHCNTPGVERDPVILSVYLDKVLMDKFSVRRIGDFKRQYYIHQTTKDEHKLLLNISRTWNPKKHGVNQDNRELGVAVRKIEFLDEMPKDGIGFYHWETWGEGQIPGWPQDVTPRFRWTGMRASLGIKGLRDLGIDASEIKNEGAFHGAGPDGGIELFLMCAHPEIDKDPVAVKIIGGNGIIREEIFKNYQWRKILLKDDELKESKALTFQMSRTWNPKLAGISEDNRDLGVAVAVLGQ